MDLQLTRQPCSSWLCQGVLHYKCAPGQTGRSIGIFKVRSIRLVGIVLSMFCLVEKVPFIR